MLDQHNNEDIIIYGSNSEESRWACDILSDMGFTQVFHFAGGLNAWIDAGFPVSKAVDENNIYGRVEQSLQEDRPVFGKSGRLLSEVINNL